MTIHLAVKTIHPHFFRRDAMLASPRKDYFVFSETQALRLYKVCHPQRTGGKNTAIFFTPQVAKVFFLLQRAPEAEHIVFRNRAATQDDKTFDDVVQLAYVARPLEALQRFQSLRHELRRRFAHIL